MPLKLENIGVSTDKGSTVHATDAEVPGDLRLVRGDGIGFGALRLTSWAESTTIIEGLRFEEADPSWFPFLMVGGAAGIVHHERDVDDGESGIDRQTLTRRGILVTAGAATAALFVGSSSGQSAGDQKTYNVATFDLIQNLRGLKVDVDVGIADWLEDENVEFFLSAGGQPVGSFTASEQGRTINPGTTGTVELESDTALSLVEELIATVGADDTVVFEFRPQDTSFAAETVGDAIALSSEPVVVETVNEAEPSEVVLKLNGTIIPHADESGEKPAGEWWVRDNTTLMYEVGPETPDTSLVEVQANVGWVDRQRERFFG